MNNIAKKITAAAMAFTLLGAGGSIANAVKPAASNTITASAAVYGQRYTVKANPYLNVRSGPSTNSSIIGKRYNNSTVYVYGFYKGWACIATDGSAWVCASYIY